MKLIAGALLALGLVGGQQAAAMEDTASFLSGTIPVDTWLDMIDGCGYFDQESATDGFIPSGTLIFGKSKIDGFTDDDQEAQWIECDNGWSFAAPVAVDGDAEPMKNFDPPSADPCTAATTGAGFTDNYCGLQENTSFAADGSLVPASHTVLFKLTNATVWSWVVRAEKSKWAPLMGVFCAGGGLPATLISNWIKSHTTCANSATQCDSWFGSNQTCEDMCNSTMTDNCGGSLCAKWTQAKCDAAYSFGSTAYCTAPTNGSPAGLGLTGTCAADCVDFVQYGTSDGQFGPCLATAP